MKSLVWQNSYSDIIHKYPDVIQAVWAQIRKDFAMEALPIDSSEIETLDEAYQKVYPHVKNYIQFQFTSLMRLLYRIDISENTVRKQMDLMPDDAAEAITTLVLQREIQKVVLRIQFSQ